VTALLEIDGLEVRYGDFQAVSGVTLDMDEGSPHAIVGANGAGKSTLLRAVAGVHPTAAGTVRFDGIDLARTAAHDRVAAGIALVPEGRRLFPSLTVEENLLVGAFRARPGPWTLERVYQLFPMLVRLAERGAAHLSGGEQQAVAIGRALMANPRLVLLDEVSLGLAPVVVRQLYQALPAIIEAGTTPLIVEQDISQALAVSDRVTCLLGGHVSLSGVPAQFDRAAITAAYFGV
jgi:branched-chain amino acid transport system ATP-binding protein